MIGIRFLTGIVINHAFEYKNATRCRRCSCQCTKDLAIENETPVLLPSGSIDRCLEVTWTGMFQLLYSDISSSPRAVPSSAVAGMVLNSRVAHHHHHHHHQSCRLLEEGWLS